MIGLLFWQYEHVEKSVDVGPSPQALRDPWLAAAQLMRRQGYQLVEDERLERLEKLDNFSTLIVSRDDFLLTEESFTRVIDWVSRGGHLIVGLEDGEGFLAQGLFLRRDIVDRRDLEPFLTDEERVYEQQVSKDGRGAPSGDVQVENLASTSLPEEASSTDATILDALAVDDEPCSAERFYSGDCNFRKLSERMRAENAAAQEVFEARKLKDAEAKVSAELPSVPAEQAWALDYARADKLTRTFVQFNGDGFRTFVDWNTRSTLIYDPPDDEHHREYKTVGNTQNDLVTLNIPEVSLVAQVGNDLLTHFLQFDAGAGTISVLINTHIWENDQIGRLDHGYFLLALVGNSENRVALLHGRQVPSLLALMSKYLPELLFSSVCLLLVHFIRRGWRFGPRAVVTYGVRRSLLEHVVASGVFLWEQQAQETLLAPVRRAVLHQLFVRMGHGFDVREPKHWARIYPALLPKLNATDQAALREALQPPQGGRTRAEPKSAAMFYRQVRLLQLLRKVL
jgi:hypothetical protein